MMQKLKAALLAVILAFTFMGGPALASSHNGIVGDGWRFEQNLAQHGEHIAWQRLTSDVLATASFYRAEDARVEALAAQIEQQRPAISAMPDSAFSDETDARHYPQIHLYSDRLANLANLLNAIGGDAVEVSSMNNAIELVKDVYATGAICGYESWLAVNAAPPATSWMDRPPNRTEWALIALVLAVMTGGSFYLARRTRRHQPSLA